MLPMEAGFAFGSQSEINTKDISLGTRRGDGLDDFLGEFGEELVIGQRRREGAFLTVDEESRPRRWSN